MSSDAELTKPDLRLRVTLALKMVRRSNCDLDAENDDKVRG